LFGDVTAAAGIQFQFGMGVPAFPPGPQGDVIRSTFGGVASGDCDLDGDVDLFVTHSDTRPNRLYRNQRMPNGTLSFVDTATSAGVDWTVTSGPPGQNGRHSGPVFADLDGDGDLDLFLGGLFGDSIKVYSNNGNCTFTDVTAGSGLTGLRAAYTFSGGFGDYDLDGDLDLVMSHWGTPDSAYNSLAGGRAQNSELLWRNVSAGAGNIQFQPASEASGVTAISYLTRSWYPPGGPATARCPRFVQTNVVMDAQQYDYIYTGTFAHLNGDIWPDLLLVGDFTTSQVLLGSSTGVFTDASTAPLCQAQQPMGSALADYDNDGDLDWFTTSVRINFLNGNVVPAAIGNRFFRNDSIAFPDFTVTDVTDSLGVAAGGWGWGACLLDIDNDTDLDIFHTNGWYQAATDQGQVVANFPADASRVFINGGASFTEQGASYGLNDTRSGRGVVCADFDNDGDLDIFQTSDTSPNSGLLRENRTAASGRNFLKVSLTGQPPNTEAVGARIYVTVTSGGAVQMREVMIGSDNYTSQNPAVQHFGLGSASIIQQVRIVWPARAGGTQQTTPTVLSAVAANQTLVCSEATATPTSC
jgi:hypothetical protein